MERQYKLDKTITKIKLLKRLTIIQIITSIIAIILGVYTFDYIFDNALNSFTSSWIGETINITSKYNVNLMNYLIIIDNISIYIFLGATALRFILMKLRFKIIYIISIVTFLMAYSIANIDNVFIQIISIVIMITAFIGMIYTHKIKGEYIENIDNTSNNNNNM